jgi:1,4-dihydroxy-2-naphthoyl-CoA synthase
MTEQSAEPQVVATVADSIMTITLNRPEQGNGWTAEITRLYFALLEQAARSAEVRVIVVTGAGKAFCVGGDGQKLDAASKNDTTMNAARTPYWMPLRVGKPVIAAINGACFGIGLQQALCADIRFASEEAILDSLCPARAGGGIRHELAPPPARRHRACHGPASVRPACPRRRGGTHGPRQPRGPGR